MLNVIQYFKARKETKRKQKELDELKELVEQKELEQLDNKFEEFKKQIEEAKKDDPFKNEIEALIRRAKEQV